MNLFLTSIRVISMAMVAACCLVYLYILVNLMLLQRFAKKNSEPDAIVKRFSLVFDDSLGLAVRSLHRMTLLVLLIALLLMGALWLFGSQADQLNLHPDFQLLTLLSVILVCLNLAAWSIGGLFWNQHYPNDRFRVSRFRRYLVFSLLLSLLFNLIFWFIKL